MHAAWYRVLATYLGAWAHDPAPESNGGPLLTIRLGAQEVFERRLDGLKECRGSDSWTRSQEIGECQWSGPRIDNLLRTAVKITLEWFERASYVWGLFLACYRNSSRAPSIRCSPNASLRSSSLRRPGLPVKRAEAEYSCAAPTRAAYAPTPRIRARRFVCRLYRGSGRERRKLGQPPRTQSAPEAPSVRTLRFARRHLLGLAGTRQESALQSAPHRSTLTPDADEEFTELTPDESYAIGGIVPNHSRFEALSRAIAVLLPINERLEKAQALGMRTAHFPVISKYVRKALTVNVQYPRSFGRSQDVLSRGFLDVLRLFAFRTPYQAGITNQGCSRGATRDADAYHMPQRTRDCQMLFSDFFTPVYYLRLQISCVARWRGRGTAHNLLRFLVHLVMQALRSATATHATQPCLIPDMRLPNGGSMVPNGPSGKLRRTKAQWRDSKYEHANSVCEYKLINFSPPEDSYWMDYCLSDKEVADDVADDQGEDDEDGEEARSRVSKN
ncbi:hypothetical protein DFH07DRAFT_767020 [Mycena maculata]|uniref:Uncharacterized protein n=1 Tax=Mycena maculata TaxID=230809 RepID=A0AAD7NUH9_9AGAR|nr:hypothetical protein DFH07DRAFT_767020 [Mycena maculata]